MSTLGGAKIANQNNHFAFEEQTIYLGPSEVLLHHFSFAVLIPWVDRVKLGHVQALVNAARDGLDFSDQLLLNVLQVVTIFWSY